jgi:hypothetical protein
VKDFEKNRCTIQLSYGRPSAIARVFWTVLSRFGNPIRWRT